MTNYESEQFNGPGVGDPGSTSGTLIVRWRRQEPDAWERLSYLYFPLIYDWCRRRGLPPEDSRDVTQNVFLSLSKCTMRFQHNDGENSFRGWLWGVTNNHIKVHFRKHANQPRAAGGSTAARRFSELATSTNGAGESVPPTFTANGRRGLVRRALELMRTDFQEPTWRAFWQTAMEGRAAVDVAGDLGISTNAVYLAKSRVLRRLREEFDGLI